MKPFRLKILESFGNLAIFLNTNKNRRPFGGLAKSGGMKCENFCTFQYAPNLQELYFLGFLNICAD